MKLAARIFHIQIILAALLVAGCATKRTTQPVSSVWQLGTASRQLSFTNTVPRASYQLQIYVVCAGDTLAMIAKRLHTTMPSLYALNPGLDARRLRIGETLLVSEQIVK